MNVNVPLRQDLIRQQGMPHLPQPVLGVNAPHFLHQQQQPPQQVQQQQGQPAHMSLLPNNPGQNPHMSLLPGAQQNSAASNSLYQLQLPQGRRNQALMQHQTQNAQGPGQLQGMGFSSQLMQPQLRRAASQPQGLNHPSVHLGGLHSAQSGIPGLGGMGINPQTAMSAQFRPVTQQQQQAQQQQFGVRLPQQPLQMQHGQMPSDLAIGMNRQNSLATNAGVPSHLNRPSTTQLISNPSQPPISHPGMQPLQQTFSNPMMSHQQVPLASSPRLSQTHPTGGVPTGIGSSTTPYPGATNRGGMTPDNTGFTSFQNTQMSQGVSHGSSRIPPPGPGFSFAPPPTPSNLLGDISQSASNSAPGATAKAFPTPAQAFGEINQSAESAQVSFNVGSSQTPAPPRPPSQLAPHPPYLSQQQPPQVPQTLSMQQSPRQTNQLLTHPQRPQSRPQSQPQVPSGQSPQTGPPRTPHPVQTPLGSGLLPPAQINRPTPPSTMVPQAPQVPPGVHRPPTGSQNIPAASSVPPATSLAPENPPSSQSQSAPSRAVPNMLGYPSNYPVGVGQGVMRLLQFSGVLASESKNKLQLQYWSSLVEEYFTTKAIMKFTLWKDNQRNEAKPFEIGTPILPRFFLVTSQSGVRSMNLSLDGVRERLMGQGHAVVECVQAVWTYRYTNGYQVTLRGPMTAHILVLPNTPNPNQPPTQPVSYSLKFDQLQFDANYHDKMILLDAIGPRNPDTQRTPRLRAPPTPSGNGSGSTGRRPEDDDRRFDEPRFVVERATIPAEPVNAFGIPQATMRCLELAESVGQMADLIHFSREHDLGPIDALTKFAQKLREGSIMNGVHPSAGTMFDGNVVSATPPVTLYPGNLKPASNQPTPLPTPLPTATDGSRQGPKTPSNAQAPATLSTSSGSGSASTPTSAPTPGISTPSMSHNTLKRKAPTQSTDSASPTLNPEQATSKRTVRKRGRTQGST